MTTITDLKTEILAKAVEDSDFRARLLADPKAVVSAETGVEIPEWYNIEIHEDTATAAHLILPPTDRLTEADLALVSGGGGAYAGQGIWGPGS